MRTILLTLLTLASICASASEQGIWVSDKAKSLEYYEKHNLYNAKLFNFLQDQYGYLSYSMKKGVWSRCFAPREVTYNGKRLQSGEMCWIGTYELIHEADSYIAVRVNENLITTDGSKDKNLQVDSPSESFVLYFIKTDENTFYIHNYEYHIVEFFTRKDS
jgi:hypothetical protein